MTPRIFVGLPVRNLSRSIDFFTALDFRFTPRFSEDGAACMIVGDTAFVMLLSRDKFMQATAKPVCGTTGAAEVLLRICCDSQEEVEGIVARAIESGASPCGERQDDGQVYGRGFQDLDGYIWELMHIRTEIH